MEVFLLFTGQCKMNDILIRLGFVATDVGSNPGCTVVKPWSDYLTFEPEFPQR